MYKRQRRNLAGGLCGGCGRIFHGHLPVSVQLHEAALLLRNPAEMCIRDRYYAEEDGIVFYYNTGLSVEEGTALVAYGIREHMIADEAG